MTAPNIEWHAKVNAAYHALITELETNHDLDPAQTRVVLESLLHGPYQNRSGENLEADTCGTAEDQGEQQAVSGLTPGGTCREPRKGPPGNFPSLAGRGIHEHPDGP